jgi:hypothetical protein
MHARNGGTWVNTCLTRGRLLQDTVSPNGDMVLFFLYVIIFAQHFLAQYALHLYNISCIVVTELQELHWWHHFKVKVKGQGHIMIKVGCQRNPYFLSSFYQINSKLGVKVAYGLPLSRLFLGPIGVDLHGSRCGLKFAYPKVKFWNWQYHFM